MWASGLEPGTLGVISNLATVTTKEIPATEQKNTVILNRKPKGQLEEAPHGESGTEKCSATVV